MEIFPNWTVIPVVFIFLVFLFILKRIFFAPMARVLEERHRRIEGARFEAEEIRKTTQDKLTDVDRRMRETRRELDAHMAQFRNEALTEKGKIVAERRSEVDRLLSETRQDIRAKSEEAQKTLQAQSGQFARRIAEQILKRPISGKNTAKA